MKNLLFIAILSIVAVFGAATVYGQRDVLAAGNPPLTGADFSAVVEFYERGLAIRFSEAERDELREKFVGAWQAGQKSRAAELIGFMKTVRKINAVNAEKIKSNQDEFKDALLGDLEKMANNGWASYVIQIYQSRSENRADTSEEDSDQTEPASTDSKNGEYEPDFQPVTGTLSAADLTGKWGKGTTATYGYRSAETNDYRSAYGAANQHDIYAGGNFDYTNYAQVSGYGCKTELYTSMKGRYSLRGAEITFSYVSGTVRVEDSCKKSVVNRPAQIKAATYRLERAGDQLRMCEVGAENPTCLYKAKD